MQNPSFIVFYDRNLALEPDVGGYVTEGSPFIIHISPNSLFDREETAALAHELTHTGQQLAGRHEDTYQHCVDMEAEAYTTQQAFLENKLRCGHWRTDSPAAGILEQSAMAVKAPHASSSRLKQLGKLAHALGESDNSVELVTFDPDSDVLAVFVDAPEHKSEHERAVLRVWIEWLAKVADEPELQLFNFSELPDDTARNRLISAYAGQFLFDRR